MKSENKLLIDCGSASGRVTIWAVLTWPFRALSRVIMRQLRPWSGCSHGGSRGMLCSCGAGGASWTSWIRSH